MSKFSWLKNVEFVAPIILSLVPGIPPALIPHIVKGIQVAETIEGASGQEKLKAAIAISTESAEGVNAVKPGLLNTPAVTEAVTSGINAVVAVSNIAAKGPAALEVK